MLTGIERLEKMHVIDRLLGKTPGRRRSSKWRKVRRKFLEINPRCESCGGIKKLEVHHVIPYHVDPSLELEFSNLMTLCRRKKYGISCHLLVGHKGNYRLINPDAYQTARMIYRYLFLR